ncbi:MAG: TonB-dependent receptor [Bacteroidales bacterium]|nr:TonB-dependent receptor [Bacteroidales bacterium]
MKKLRFLLLLFSIWSTTALMAQEIKIQGIIVDKKNGEPLIGATVLQKGTTNGTITNFDGVFTISAPINSTITISYVGYTSEEIVAKKNETQLRIELNPDTELLEEVVVVGYGSQKAKDMTAPISTVKGTDLNKQTTSNAMSALQGKMSGVQIVNNGAPGTGPSVKIRGVGSIGDYANPLYVVDGVFVDNIDFLSSGDIEDLTVLKDASAAAIYGVRAANGVVLVTTKKGKIDQTNVSYEGYAGIQIPVNVMKLATRDQYVEIINEANANTTGYIPKVASNYPASTDWYSKLLRNAMMHSHAIDISGATEKTSYSVGVNYFFQEGIMKAKNDYERFNFRARIDQKVNDWFNIGFNTVISDYNKNNAKNDAFFSAFVNPPVYSVYDDTNTAAYPVLFGSPQTYGFGNQYGNPVAAAYYNNDKEDGLKLVFSTFAEFTIIPQKLKFKTSYNMDFGYWKSQNYTSEFNVGGSQGVRKSSLSKTFGIKSKQIIDNLLTYTDKIDAHSFNVMLGQSTRMEHESWMTGSAQDVPGFDDQSIYLTTGSFRDRSANDGASTYNGISFFTRGSYNYADKYLATVTFRADASSKYQEKWGYFPSVGLGWILTGEDFMENQNTFQFLKIRASWGLLGNDNIPANSAVILGSSGAGSSGIFGDVLVDGVGAQTVVQRYLKWEVVNEINFGVDFTLMNQKLKGDLDFYNRVTNNVVFYAPIATGGGTAELLSNNGKVQNRGIELNLNWSDKISKDLSYNIGFNATTVENKVLKLEGRDYIPGASIRGNYTTRTAVGHAIGSFYGYEIDKVYESESEALRDPINQDIKLGGYFKYKNQNNDQVIDDKDKVYLGSPIPWLMSGIDFGLNYKKMDMSVSFQGQFGNKVLNAKRMNRDVFADGNYDLDFYNNRWTITNKSSNYPSAEAYNTSFIQQANDFFVEDASYIRIQNMQVGYTFDNIKRVKSLRIYVSAQRPFTYFTYKGFTPEVGGSPISNGIDTSVYPMQAIYSVGLKMNL